MLSEKKSQKFVTKPHKANKVGALIKLARHWRQVVKLVVEFVVDVLVSLNDSFRHF